MRRKSVILVALTLLMAGGSLAQNRTAKDYKVMTNQVLPAKSSAEVSDSIVAEQWQPEEHLDFISRNFRYVSMCEWQPGMRFMVVPSQKDLVIKTFAEWSTGNMVSNTALKDKIMVYEGHSAGNNGLHEHVNFHLEENPTLKYYFEVPTSTFDDYCYGKVGVPALAYLGDVDTAIDSLVGKQVRVLVRLLCQDTGTNGSGYNIVDIDSKRGQVMTITKAGIGTRNFPVKLVVSDGQQEYFQYVAISRTNSGLRDDEFEVDDLRQHSFRDVFELLDDKMAVSADLRTYIGQTVYTMLESLMRDEKEQLVKVPRLSTFVVEDMYSLGGKNNITLKLRRPTTGKLYTKDVILEQLSSTDRTELFRVLFALGDPATLPNISKSHMTAIQQGKVMQGFTEEEVRLALGEPSEIEPTRNGIYRWKYQYTDTGRPFHSITFKASTRRVSNATR